VRLLVSAALVALIAGAAAPGSLDPSFGSHGRVFASFSADDTASGIAVQRDGKVLVSGRIDGKLALVRFDARGKRDRSFGRSGLVRRQIGTDAEEGPVRIAVQPDGKIVFAGTTSDLNTDNSLGDGAFAIYRLTPSGRPDTSFGNRGGVLVRTHGRQLIGAGLALDTAGRIVVASRYEGLDNGGATVLRLTRNGGLDPAFGRKGQADLRFATVDGVVVDRAARVYVAGTTVNDRVLAVVRLTARGRLDRSYGRRGIATLARRGDLALSEAVAIQPDGRVVLAGVEGFLPERAPAPCSDCDFLVLGRITPAGRADRSFGEAGVVHTRFEQGSGLEMGLALQRNGRIVVATGIEGAFSAGSSFLLARFLADGAPDPEFRGHGYAITDMRSAKRNIDFATAVALAPGGRIVVAGRSARDALEGSTVQWRFALARFFG
jgi:uncharacterized delta-60 repeat protein